MVVSRFIAVAGILLTTTMAVPTSATVLVRKGLDQLTIGNETVVQARVLDLHSYWNDDHSFILTDVHARPSRVLKGADLGDVTFTVMGGSVGDVSIVVLGGPDLSPGAEYLLFLAHADVPGAAHRLTLPDLAQGAFEIDGGWVFSQAVDEPLLPDENGFREVAGGRAGLALDDFLREVRLHAAP